MFKSIRPAFHAASALRVSISGSRTSFMPAASVAAQLPISWTTSTVPSTARFYHEKVIDHYSRPRNAGSLDRNDPSVGSALVGAPACGDVIKLDIKVDEHGTIVDSKFKTFGCGSAIASSSYLTTLVKGMRLDDAAKIKNLDISRELCLPPVKLHCSLLAEYAIKSAIANYHSKQTNLSGAATKTLADMAVETPPPVDAVAASA